MNGGLNDKKSMQRAENSNKTLCLKEEPKKLEMTLKRESEPRGHGKGFVVRLIAVSERSLRGFKWD